MGFAELTQSLPEIDFSLARPLVEIERMGKVPGAFNEETKSVCARYCGVEYEGRCWENYALRQPLTRYVRESRCENAALGP